MKELVFQGQNYQALTNSLLVAEKFGKRYDSVFRSINQMIGDSPQKSDKLFVISSYIDSSGKENQMYVMNRKGFSILVMGCAGFSAAPYAC
jgi:phage regulatory protein, rha family